MRQERQLFHPSTIDDTSELRTESESISKIQRLLKFYERSPLGPLSLPRSEIGRVARDWFRCPGVPNSPSRYTYICFRPKCRYYLYLETWGCFEPTTLHELGSPCYSHKDAGARVLWGHGAGSGCLFTQDSAFLCSCSGNVVVELVVCWLSFPTWLSQSCTPIHACAQLCTGP